MGFFDIFRAKKTEPKSTFADDFQPLFPTAYGYDKWFANSGVWIGYGLKIPRYLLEAGFLEGDGRFSDEWPLYYNGEAHVMLLGPTGSGKNSTNQTPTLLTYQGSAVVIDPKGQLCAITGAYRRRMGQRVVTLNPFDVLGLWTSTYNPLAHLDPHSLTFSTDTQTIAQGIITQTKGDHWELSAIDLVALLIQWSVIYGTEKNLNEVRRILSTPDKAREEFFLRLTECDNPLIAEGAGRYASDSKEVRDCVQTAVVQMACFRDAGISQVLAGGDDEINFGNLKKRPTTVYLIIPPEYLNTHGKFLRLIVMSALNELIKERTKPRQRVLMMLDEFAQLGPLPIIENAAAIVRDYQIQLYLILQNLPQLKALYPQKWQSFLSSAGVVQVLTPNDEETAKYVSARSGEKTLIRSTNSTSRSTSRSDSKEGWSNNSGNSTSTSDQYYTESRLKIDNVYSIRKNQMAIVISGRGGIIEAGRANYFEDTRFKDRAAPDPYHGGTVDPAAILSSSYPREDYSI